MSRSSWKNLVMWLDEYGIWVLTILVALAGGFYGAWLITSSLDGLPFAVAFGLAVFVVGPVLVCIIAYLEYFLLTVGPPFAYLLYCMVTGKFKVDKKEQDNDRRQ